MVCRQVKSLRLKESWKAPDCQYARNADWGFSLNVATGSMALSIVEENQTPNRYQRALQMRTDGRSYREIAAEFRISVQAAQQIVMRAKKRHLRHGLSIRAYNCLINVCGFIPSKPDLSLIKDCYFLRMKNVGRQTLKEIRQWQNS